MNKKLKASFTIEITYILFFIFCGIAFIIGYAIDKHIDVVNNVELHFLAECISHNEKNIGYEKERLKGIALENINERESIDVREKFLEVEVKMGEKTINVSVFNPEAYMRATTALEGIYERAKGKLPEESEE